MRHFSLTCVNHPTKRWKTKSIAWTGNAEGYGFYNGCRNIFYSGDTADPDSGECPCKANCLRLAPEETGIDETEI